MGSIILTIFVPPIQQEENLDSSGDVYFFFLLDAVIINSYILYLSKHVQGNFSHRDVRLQLARSLVGEVTCKKQTDCFQEQKKKAETLEFRMKVDYKTWVSTFLNYKIYTHAASFALLKRKRSDQK